MDKTFLNLTGMTHLVHIGFDKGEQPDFESRIIKRLQSTADDATHVLNFVDESPFIDEDVELMQKNKLAETLSSFIAVCHLKSTPLSQHFDYDRRLDDIPQEVIAFLKKRLDGEWQHIETPCTELDDFLATGPTGELPDDIRDARDKHDKIRLGILGERFIEILEDMATEFKGKNIFQVRSGKGTRNDEVANTDRRGRIIESAEALFGRDRIIFSGMRDGDMNKVIAAIHGKQTDTDFEKFLEESDFEYHDWEKPQGNASDMLMHENRALSITRAERYRKIFLESLDMIGVAITEQTEHILGGEYYGRCVHSYGTNLGFYGIQHDRIHPDEEISLSAG